MVWWWQNTRNFWSELRSFLGDNILSYYPLVGASPRAEDSIFPKDVANQPDVVLNCLKLGLGCCRKPLQNSGFLLLTLLESKKFKQSYKNIVHHCYVVFDRKEVVEFGKFLTTTLSPFFCASFFFSFISRLPLDTPAGSSTTMHRRFAGSWSSWWSTFSGGA